MATIIIDTKTNEAKRLVEYLKTIKYVKVLDSNQEMTENLDPDFVEKIKKREKQLAVKLDLDKLWK
jgi:hypothetical protein